MALVRAGRWSKRIGVTFLVLSGMFYVVAMMMLALPREGEGPLESLVPGMFFGTVLLIPGLVLYLSGRKKARTAEFEQTVLGYIRSHDRFSSSELAAKIDCSEMEVERLIARLTTLPELDLVFHRPDRSWIHRGRIAGSHAVVDRCNACGANIGQQLILSGEEIRCTYCDKVLMASA